MRLICDLFPAVDDWRHRSACRTRDPELWWADDPNHERSKLAISICGACPVQTDCLEYAVSAREIEGIWGGLTAAQRRALARERRRNAEAVA